MERTFQIIMGKRSQGRGNTSHSSRPLLAQAVLREQQCAVHGITITRMVVELRSESDKNPIQGGEYELDFIETGLGGELGGVTGDACIVLGVKLSGKFPKLDQTWKLFTDTPASSEYSPEQIRQLAFNLLNRDSYFASSEWYAFRRALLGEFASAGGS